MSTSAQIGAAAANEGLEQLEKRVADLETENERLREENRALRDPVQDARNSEDPE